MKDINIPEVTGMYTFSEEKFKSYDPEQTGETLLITMRVDENGVLNHSYLKVSKEGVLIERGKRIKINEIWSKWIIEKLN